jgi:hypothetical protein
MSKVQFIRIGLVLPGAVLILLSQLLAPTGAEAAMAGCRADPILYLSNGTVMTITVDIGADVSAVKSIMYTVRVPQGVKLVRAVYTPFPGFTGKEKLQVQDDAQAGQYVSDTVVQTDNKNIVVVATTHLVSKVQAVSGYSNQHLVATLNQ